MLLLKRLKRVSWAPKNVVAEIASKGVYRKRKSSGLSPFDRVTWEIMTGIQQMDKNNSLLFQLPWNGCVQGLLYDKTLLGKLIGDSENFQLTYMWAVNPHPQMSYLKSCHRKILGWDVRSCSKAVCDQKLLLLLMISLMEHHLPVFVTVWLWKSGIAIAGINKGITIAGINKGITIAGINRLKPKYVYGLTSS
ncbi:hypothetical protein KIW84_051455 [Lathyrus oleraceus]|uniref:Uncharacterized protein n=1 Tax=Pisum sativum TaxID=3888 RepID=A0A9D4WK69_PEA|nr:hypothetical protein KIW84_051455 [Pisum sativum]